MGIKLYLLGIMVLFVSVYLAWFKGLDYPCGWNYLNTPSINACAKFAKDNCIINSGSFKTELNEFPYMAAVGRTNGKTKTLSFDCGGTVIDNKFVLTSAFCIGLDKDEKLFVRLGNGYVINVRRPIIHPDNNPRKKIADIALLELEEAINFNDSIKPACLPTNFGFEKNILVAIGWGISTDDDSELSNSIKKIPLDQLNIMDCSDSKVNNPDEHICTAKPNSYEEIYDISRGYSGGPIVIMDALNKNCLVQLVGIIGVPKACDVEGSRSIHTRVFPYNNWIEKIVW